MKEMKMKTKEKGDEPDPECDSGRVSETDKGAEYAETEESEHVEPYKMEIVWQNVFKFIILHSLYFYSMFYFPTLSWKMYIHIGITALFSGLGITMGAHRLWSHKTYKAKLPLRFILTIGNSMAGQNSIYVWSRDHRTHHKFSEQMGDPHNAKRGFFFAHMGWLLVRKHPEVIRAGKTIDMSDLESDKLVMFQHKHYIASFLILGFIIPTLLPYFLWGESLATGFFITVFRYAGVLHGTWLVNSAAHFYGNKPYDKNIGPTENMFVSFLAMGEGFHNYHHTFPWDYRTSEWGYSLNITSRIIDAMAYIGQAYNLQKASPEVIAARSKRIGNPDLTFWYQKKKKSC